MEKSSLIEPGIRYYMSRELKNYANQLTKKNNMYYNFGLFILLVLFVGLVLFFKYRGKLSEEELKKREQMKNESLLASIREYQEKTEKVQDALLTGLPLWS